MKLLAAAFVMTCFPAIALGQIATVDAIGQSQRVQQIQQALRQVEQLEHQVATARQQLSNVSGITGLADLLPNELDQLARTLPNEWEEVYYQLMQGDQLSGQSGHIFNRDQQAISSRNVTDAGEYVRQQQDQQYAVDEAMATDGYNAQLQRIEDLKTAVRALNNSSTAKEVMDLNTRIAITQATIEVERNKYMLADMLSRANQQRLQFQEREVAKRRLYGDEGSDNSLPPFPSLGGQ